MKIGGLPYNFQHILVHYFGQPFLETNHVPDGHNNPLGECGAFLLEIGGLPHYFHSILFGYLGLPSFWTNHSLGGRHKNNLLGGVGGNTLVQVIDVAPEPTFALDIMIY